MVAKIFARGEEFLWRRTLCKVRTVQQPGEVRLGGRQAMKVQFPGFFEPFAAAAEDCRVGTV